MFCRFCGKENRDGTRFCTGCGKLLYEEEPGQTWTGPEGGATEEKPASSGRGLLIIFGVLGVAALAAVILLAVVIFRTDRSKSSSETDIERDRDEEDGRRTEGGDGRDNEEEGSGDAGNAVEEGSPDGAGNADPDTGAAASTDPSVWMAGYVGWLETHEEMTVVSLVAIDDDDIPECLVWRQDGSEWDATLYVLSYRESGIEEYSTAARDICFEAQENSGRFACMTYSGLGTSWDMVELSGSGFAFFIFSFAASAS